MNKPHKHAELIKAWADGATIEALNEPTNAWYLAEPLWHTEVQYRIKPEPKWYDNIPEQGVLCFVAQKQHELEQSQLVRIIFEFFDGRFIKKRFPMSGKLFKSYRFFKRTWNKHWNMCKKPIKVMIQLIEIILKKK